MLRNLVCKHSFDDRYNGDKAKQARIAALYLPLLDVLVENLGRLDAHAAGPAPLAPHYSQSGTTSVNKTNSF
jgi:hypothetical protein